MPEIARKVVVALDINGTLLKRFHKQDRTGLDMLKDQRGGVVINKHKVYHRPHLRELGEFLARENVTYVFWSTMQHQNLKLYVESLHPFGLSGHAGLYDESHCKVGGERGRIKASKWLKDLRVLADAHNVPLENCVLVDDDELKSAAGCNFIHIKEYDPNEPDTELLALISKLGAFLDASQN